MITIMFIVTVTVVIPVMASTTTMYIYDLGFRAQTFVFRA